MRAEEWGERDSKEVNQHGVKARIGKAAKSDYSEWRRTVGHGCYANDVDWIEWRVGSDGPRAVAVIETTFYEDKPEWRHLLPRYCNCVLARFKRDAQYSITRMVAERLSAPAYLVIARYDLEVFWICRLRDDEWRQATRDQYREWLIRLGRDVQ